MGRHSKSFTLPNILSATYSIGVGLTVLPNVFRHTTKLQARRRNRTMTKHLEQNAALKTMISFQPLTLKLMKMILKRSSIVLKARTTFVSRNRKFNVQFFDIKSLKSASETPPLSGRILVISHPLFVGKSLLERMPGLAEKRGKKQSCKRNGQKSRC